MSVSVSVSVGLSVRVCKCVSVCVIMCKCVCTCVWRKEEGEGRGGGGRVFLWPCGQIPALVDTFKKSLMMGSPVFFPLAWSNTFKSGKRLFKGKSFRSTTRRKISADGEKYSIVDLVCIFLCGVYFLAMQVGKCVWCAFSSATPNAHLARENWSNVAL